MLQQSQLFAQFPLSQPDYSNLAVGPAEQRQAVALGSGCFTCRRPAGGSAAGMPTRGMDGRRPRWKSFVPCTTADFRAYVRRELQQQQRPEGPRRFPDRGSVSAHQRRRHLPCPPRTGCLRRDPARRTCCRRSPTMRWARPSTVIRSRPWGSTSSGASCSTGHLGPVKTHTVRYLLSQGQGTTAILLSGGSLAFVSEAAQDGPRPAASPSSS